MAFFRLVDHQKRILLRTVELNNDRINAFTNLFNMVASFGRAVLVREFIYLVLSEILKVVISRQVIPMLLGQGSGTFFSILNGV